MAASYFDAETETTRVHIVDVQERTPRKLAIDGMVNSWQFVQITLTHWPRYGRSNLHLFARSFFCPLRPANDAEQTEIPARLFLACYSVGRFAHGAGGDANGRGLPFYFLGHAETGLPEVQLFVPQFIFFDAHIQSDD